MKTMNQYYNEVSMIREAQQLADRAKREDSPYLVVPRLMLEHLIEKATRPHD